MSCDIIKNALAMNMASGVGSEEVREQFSQYRTGNLSVWTNMNEISLHLNVILHQEAPLQVFFIYSIGMFTKHITDFSTFKLLYYTPRTIPMKSKRLCLPDGHYRKNIELHKTTNKYYIHT